MRQLARACMRVTCLTGFLLLQAAAQPAHQSSALAPLPQDTGAAGLKQMLLRLNTTARLLHITAHPDDEDGGMLTLESRGKGVTTTLLTLNRGEGGQNKVGSNLFDVLGVLRSLELIASDRYYGVEQRFTRVADFGYSKSSEETFQKWQGHDTALADMVRVIRTFRPDVIASRFRGTEQDGHGHHEAAGILAREAFRAAADPNRFPEQIKEGLLPWQAKKLYVDGFGMGDDYTVKLNTGEENSALGMSYVHFAMEGLRRQQSQGVGNWSIPSGPRYTYYKLVDSVLPPTKDKEGHESDFWDGIDISLPGLASALGPEEREVPFLRRDLEEIAGQIQKALDKSEPNKTTEPLFRVVNGFNTLLQRVKASALSTSPKHDLLLHLREKEDQASIALNLALNVSLEATVSPPRGPGAGLPSEQEALTVVSPGQKFTLLVKFHNGSKHTLHIHDVFLDLAENWISGMHRGDMTVLPGEDHHSSFYMRVPSNASYTRPYWHRNDPEQEGINKLNQPQFATLPFTPTPFQVGASYSISGHKDLSLRIFSGSSMQLRGSAGPGAQVSTSVQVPFLDSRGVEQRRSLAVAPIFSVSLHPGEQVIPLNNGRTIDVRVIVSSNLANPPNGTLQLEIPRDWRVEPPQAAVRLHSRGDRQEFTFRVAPSSLLEGRAQIRALLRSANEQYREGYTLVTGEDLDAAYYYQPAVQRLSIVDVRVPKDLKVGYIMGAGDDIPTVLKQLGMNVTIIPAEKIASEDLSQYRTIVLGIRAYDTQKDLVANNKKLLDYVSNGGTLLVQYNASAGDFNNGHLTPYPAQLSRARVSVEEAPVEILAPEDSVFRYPNQISQRDFDGWVQERGLYFMDQWDAQFKPLLASHDPGEEPQQGGLLRASFGKGTYIYTGYAFFRQLPAGVPGAIRLYVNLLSAGHTP